jgi:hypothetical protein
MYGAVILPAVLYGYGTWSLILKVFGNRLRRKIFGRKREETSGS